MKNLTVIGLVVGAILGIIESLILSTDSGFGRLLSDLTLASAVLGVVISLVRPKFSATGSFLGAGAGIGVIFGLIMALRSGMYLDDGVLMAINGALIATAMVFVPSMLAKK